MTAAVTITPSSTISPSKLPTRDADCGLLSAEKINAAYEALDTMRQLNLELQCDELGIPCDKNGCTTCLLAGKSRARFPRLAQLAQQVQPSKQKAYFPKLRQLVDSEQHQSRKDPPCLICGTPICKQCASKDFGREGIIVCLNCETLFGLQFVIDCLTEPRHELRQRKMDHLLDVYDRVLLLLQYSSQYIPTIADQLENAKETQNKIGLGSSGVGVVSGALGLAAAATILTPAGPPLLVASLLFGGSATAVQTGSEALNYYSEPQQLAKRIMALHGMLWSILRIAGVVRDAMIRDHIRSELYTESSNSITMVPEDQKLRQALDRNKSALLGAAGLTSLGRYSAATAEIGAGGGARFVTRSGTNIMRGARFARFAGGALSAAILVLEAKNLNDTIRDIQSGNPCQNAQRLRQIADELHDQIPPTMILDGEIHRYLKVLHDRERAMTEDEVTKILVEQSEAAQKEQEELKQKEEQEKQRRENNQGGTLIVDGEETQSASTPTSDIMSLSLLERIELHKKKEQTVVEEVGQTTAQSTSSPASPSRQAPQEENTLMLFGEGFSKRWHPKTTSVATSTAVPFETYTKPDGSVHSANQCFEPKQANDSVLA